jgi:hypothetical protein
MPTLIWISTREEGLASQRAKPVLPAARRGSACRAPGYPRKSVPRLAFKLEHHDRRPQMPQPASNYLSTRPIGASGQRSDPGIISKVDCNRVHDPWCREIAGIEERISC